MSECLFKVAWREAEPNPPGGWFGDEREVAGGTTLAIAWDDPPRVIRACLTTGADDDQREARDRFLLRLDDEGVLLPAGHTKAFDGEPLRSVVSAELGGGRMRVRGTARMLHVAPMQTAGTGP